MRKFIGPILILLGIYLFANRGDVINSGELIGYFWPSMFILPLGLFFHWLYFSVTNRRGIGLLIPGGILFVVGAVCQISMLLDNWAFMWPGFILAPAAGLFEFYWFGNKNKYLLIPINILTVLSLMFFAIFSIGSLYNRMIYGQPILAVLCIAAGAWMMFGLKQKKV